MELEGVQGVRPAEEDHEYYFNVMCGSCRETHPKVISLNMTVCNSYPSRSRDC